MAQNLGNLFIDGESTIEDETGNHTITAVGDASISTSQKKFGNSSIYSPGNDSDYITIDDHSDFEFRTGNFTIDFWLYQPALVADTTVFSKCISTGDGSGNFVFYNFNNALQLYMGADGSAFDIVAGNKKWTITSGVWQHIALVRSGTTFSLYTNGVLDDTFEDSSDITSDGSSLTLLSRTYNSGAMIDPTNGYLDNFRITKGTALWTENFDVDDTDAMFYTPIPETGTPYVRPDKITKFYSASSQGNLRGKAAEGFIRPTIKQFFAPYKMKFEEITSHIIKGYIFGGYGTVSLKDTDEYLASLDTWTSKTDISSPRWYFAASTIDNKGYIYGGGSSPKDCDEYIVDTWTSKTGIDIDFAYHTAETLNSKGYIFNGFGGGARNGEVREYFTNTWTTKTSVPLPGRSQISSFNIENKGYVLGGYTASPHASNADNDEYVPDTWTSKTDMLRDLHAQVSNTINNKGYVMCGALLSVYSKYNDEYSPDSWVNKTDYSYTKSAEQSLVALDNKLYLIAGNTGSYSVKDVDEYTPDTWTNKTDIPDPARYINASCAI